MKVADLMTREVMTVGPETTLREVASLLATEHIGGVPVVTNESILGVVSATDLVDFDADSSGVPARRELQGEGFGEIPEEPAWEVGTGEEAVGDYFTGFWEDVGAEVTERFEEPSSPEWNVLDEHVASEIMTRAVFSVSPETDVEEVARRMLEAEVHRALVLEDDRLVGVLSTLDILRAVAEVGLAR